jgi:hypothetical protein
MPSTSPLPSLRQRLSSATSLFVAILWLGLLLGVSFLATPVKFQAPSLDLPTALEVGRVTFALFCKVEWGLFALLALSMFLAPPRVWRWACLAALLGIMMLETCWLLPILDARVSEVISGTDIPGTHHHFLYIAAESVKAVLLLALSIAGLGKLIKS